MLRTVAVAGVLGMLLLSPVQFISLPLNMALVDVWNTLSLSVAWLYLIRVRQVIRLPYVASVWLILLGGLAGTFVTTQPSDSLAFIIKDVYLYIWFVTVVALVSSFNSRILRPILLVWLVVVVLHGILVVAQFLSPELFQMTAAFAERFGALDQWRPSGLFENANAAAFFQLMGFVPLVLLRPSRAIGLVAGTLLLGSILATGSMGTTAGFVVGLTIAAIAIAGRDRASIAKVLPQLAIAALLLGGLFYFFAERDPDVASRFEGMFYDRAEGSAEGRLSLWKRGIDFFSSEMPIFGIGPDAYKDVDPLRKRPHNDLFAFLLERGLIGALGFVLFSTAAVVKSIHLFVKQKQRGNPAALTVVVFLAAIAAALVDAQFHQVFHQRSLWLVLALQEAMLVGGVAFASAPSDPAD